jgi:hypothetical protein
MSSKASLQGKQINRPISANVAGALQERVKPFNLAAREKFGLFA